jgi:DNA-binding CsgD family transcriptional regulator
MNYSSQLPWMKINDFLLYSETLSDSKEFCTQIVKKLYSLIPYDQVRIYFVDCNGKVYDKVLIGVEQRWIDIYFEYYSKVENGRYSIRPIRLNDNGFISKFKGKALDYTNSYGRDEFIDDYIRPQGIKYSLGFGLHSADNFSYIIFSLDRTNNSKYTQNDINIMDTLQPHLDNLHKRLPVHGLTTNDNKKSSDFQVSLTKREWEIAELLCKGMTPKNISTALFLSISTTYKHIANIHTKLDVSNCQELILRIMRAKV